jgi:hypothetical protein
MRANLYIVDASGTTTLMDGNLTNYHSIYSNAVDINDAWKMINPGINFGIKRDGIDLVVERRSIISLADTTTFRMWNMPQKNYRLKFMLKNLNHPNLYAILKDSYLHNETTIGLNDTTYVDFAINSDPASADQYRFQLVYSSYLSAPVDVFFTGIQAQRKGKDVMVEWNVSGEVSVDSYIVEHSVDGINFSELKQVSALNTAAAKTYNYKDISAFAGNNFYRVKAVNFGGRIQYSSIVKLSAFAMENEITVYPNPVANKTVQLQFSNQPAGKYIIALIYNNGAVQQLRTIQLSSGQTTSAIALPNNLGTGIYQLQIIGPDNTKTVKTIQVL